MTEEHKAYGCLYGYDFPRLKQADVTQRAPPGVQLELGVEEAAVGREGMSELQGGERPG